MIHEEWEKIAHGGRDRWLWEVTGRRPRKETRLALDGPDIAYLLYLREIPREMPFASGDAHSARPKRSEARPGAEAFSLFGRLSEISLRVLPVRRKKRRGYWLAG
jgi:hypothetical protein